jgi:hypothetical protein
MGMVRCKVCGVTDSIDYPPEDHVQLSFINERGEWDMVLLHITPEEAKKRWG